jgi:hypothetical protein
VARTSIVGVAAPGRRDRARSPASDDVIDAAAADHRSLSHQSCAGLVADAQGRTMSLGPVQLIVLGFDHPDFRGEIVAEIERLSENDAVRVIDALAVYKDADGELEVAHLSNVPDEQAPELGRVVGALIGIGVEGEEHLEVGETTTAEQDGWDVLDDIPRDTAAALLLIEHHWAVPLRDAIARAGGFRIGDGFISPLDLVATGLVSAEEAQALHAIEDGAAATT